MSQIINIPKSDILPHPDLFRCKVEESWSKYVTEETGANAPIDEPFNREAAILKAIDIKNKSK